jgi:hypothetical protein
VPGVLRRSDGRSVYCRNPGGRRPRRIGRLSCGADLSLHLNLICAKELRRYIRLKALAAAVARADQRLLCGDRWLADWIG